LGKKTLRRKCCVDMVVLKKIKPLTMKLSQRGAGHQQTKEPGEWELLKWGAPLGGKVWRVVPNVKLNVNESTREDKLIVWGVNLGGTGWAGVAHG